VGSRNDVVIVQLRNPAGQGEPTPVLRVFDDERMRMLKRAFFEDTVRQVAEIKDIDIKLAVAPLDRVSWAHDAVESLMDRYPRRPEYRNLADRVEILTQDVAPLEDRTASNLKHCLDSGYKRAVLVGGFTPTLDPDRVKDALGNLQKHPIILGPTIEGGCYLIGLRCDCPEALGLVTVGSDVAYKRSTAALANAGLSWQEIELSYDVGHQEDLEFVINEINHCRYTGDEETGRCTETVLAEFMQESDPSDDGDHR
jgi:uncharacterized protein